MVHIWNVPTYFLSFRQRRIVRILHTIIDISYTIPNIYVENPWNLTFYLYKYFKPHVFKLSSTVTENSLRDNLINKFRPLRLMTQSSDFITVFFTQWLVKLNWHCCRFKKVIDKFNSAQGTEPRLYDQTTMHEAFKGLYMVA